MTRRDRLLATLRLVPSVYANVALTVAILAIGIAWLGEPVPLVARADEGPLSLGVALVALQSLPLLARRKAPLVVLVAVMTGSVLYAAFTFPPGPMDVAELIALYSVAVHRPVRALGLGGALVVTALLLTWAVSPLWDAGVLELIAVLCVFAVVAVAGLRQRSRLRLIAAKDEQEAELAQARAERAVAEERVALARELHDAVGHAQTVVLFHAGIARMTFDSDPGRSRRALDVVEDRSRATLEEMQGLVDSLRNTVEGDRAPLPTLADLEPLLGTANDVGLEVTLAREGTSVKLPTSVDVSAYRIIQEALTNVVRHAHASQVTVTLRYLDQELRIEVRDDGVGNASPAGSSSTEPGRFRRSRSDRTAPVKVSGGNGLVGMRERAASLGGDLEAGPCVDGGFLVTAWLPIPAAAPLASETVEPEPASPAALRLVDSPQHKAKRDRAS